MRLINLGGRDEHTPAQLRSKDLLGADACKEDGIFPRDHDS